MPVIQAPIVCGIRDQVSGGNECASAREFPPIVFNGAIGFNVWELHISSSERIPESLRTSAVCVYGLATP